MRRISQASQRVQQTGIRHIRQLADRIPDAIHLEIGEPSFPTPEHIRQAAATALDEGKTRYTENAGVPELRTAIATKLASRNGLHVQSDQVVVYPGAIGALFAIGLALCDPGDEVLLPDPGWPNYQVIANSLGLVTRRYPLYKEHSWEPRPEDIERMVTPKTCMIVLNTPSNPTGAVLSWDVLQAVVDIAELHDLWLVSDEVYDEIVFNKNVAPSPSALGSNRVLAVYSMSKTYAMTGWRIGYATSPPDLTPHLIRTQLATTTCANAPGQFAAVAALTGPQQPVVEMREAYRYRRDLVSDLLGSAGVDFELPGGAFYLWVDVSRSGLSGSEFAERLLRERSVAVAPGEAFGPGWSTHIRLSLATEQSSLVEGVSRLLEFLTNDVE